MYEFRWNQWNVDHIAKHDVSPSEAEQVVDAVRQPWPERIGDNKWRVWGKAGSGRYLQVIYVFSPEDIVYVIHARDLDDAEKRRYRKRQR